MARRFLMMIASTTRDLYAPNLGGGQVGHHQRQVRLPAHRAYLIKDGRITAPVRGDPSLTVFGKSGQGVPGGIGHPSLKMGNLTVSGAEVWGQKTVKASDMRIEQETGVSLGTQARINPI